MKFRTVPGLLICSISLSAALAADKVETVPLKIELPKPVYIVTPTTITPDFPVEPLPKKPVARPLINVPKGTELLSLKKKVTSSEDAPLVGNLAMVTDGDKEAEDGHWVELGPGIQWVQIDLEKSAGIQAIVLWHFHKEPRAYRDVVVQISDDPEFKDAKTVYNSDQKNELGLGAGRDKGYFETAEGKLIAVSGTNARYVRFYSKGNNADDNNQYTEVEVWGLPAK